MLLMQKIDEKDDNVWEVGILGRNMWEEGIFRKNEREEGIFRKNEREEHPCQHPPPIKLAIKGSEKGPSHKKLTPWSNH